LLESFIGRISNWFYRRLKFPRGGGLSREAADFALMWLRSNSPLYRVAIKLRRGAAARHIADALI